MHAQGSPLDVRDSEGHTPGQLFHEDTPPAAVAAVERLLQAALAAAAAAAAGAQPDKARHSNSTTSAAAATATGSGSINSSSGGSSGAAGGRLQQAQEAAVRLREVVAGRGHAGRFNSTQVTLSMISGRIALHTCTLKCACYMCAWHMNKVECSVVVNCTVALDSAGTVSRMCVLPCGVVCVAQAPDQTWYCLHGLLAYAGGICCKRSGSAKSITTRSH
jgi:hypothetical protein